MIVDRYVTREVTHPFWAAGFALLVIFVTFSLSRFLVSADAGLLQPGEVIYLTALKSIISLDALLPLSLYLGVMTGLGRLYSDSEIYAMRAGGISENRLLRPLMRLTFVLAVIVVLLSGWVRPWAYTQSFDIKARAEASAETGRIKEARFYSFGDAQRTVFIERIADNGRDLEGIFVHTGKGDYIQVMTASRGLFIYFAKPHFHSLILHDARVFKKVENGADFSAQFGTFSLLLPIDTPQAPGYRAKSASTNVLRQSTDSFDRAEFQWRLSTPVSALLLTLLAIPLSRSRPRQGRFAKLLLALVIYAIYFSLLGLSRSWVEQGVLSYIWWVPASLGVIVVWMYWPSQAKKRRRRHAQN